MFKSVTLLFQYLWEIQRCIQDSNKHLTAQKMKLSVKNFFSKCDQIRRKLQIWSHLLKKSLMKNFIFCAVSKSVCFAADFHLTLWLCYLKSTMALTKVNEIEYILLFISDSWYNCKTLLTKVDCADKFFSFSVLMIIFKRCTSCTWAGKLSFSSASEKTLFIVERRRIISLKKTNYYYFFQI